MAIVARVTLEEQPIVAGLVYAGMGPDVRLLVGKARKSAQAYKRTYGDAVRPRSLPHAAMRGIRLMLETPIADPWRNQALVRGAGTRGTPRSRSRRSHAGVHTSWASSSPNYPAAHTSQLFFL